MKDKTEVVDKLERFLIDNKDIKLETLKEIYPFLNDIKKQLSIHVVGSSKRVKILDQRNGDCGIISDEILEHYKKEDYFEEGDLLYSCELIEKFTTFNTNKKCKERNAKKLALICVDEMIKENLKRGQPTIDLELVKQELNNK